MTATTVADEPLLLTVPEACARLRISRWTFYRLIGEGRVETIRLGSRRLVPVAGLERLIERSAQESRL